MERIRLLQNKSFDIQHFVSSRGFLFAYTKVGTLVQLNPNTLEVIRDWNVEHVTTTIEDLNNVARPKFMMDHYFVWFHNSKLFVQDVRLPQSAVNITLVNLWCDDEWDRIRCIKSWSFEEYYFVGTHSVRRTYVYRFNILERKNDKKKSSQDMFQRPWMRIEHPEPTNGCTSTFIQAGYMVSLFTPNNRLEIHDVQTRNIKNQMYCHSDVSNVFSLENSWIALSYTNTIKIGTQFHVTILSLPDFRVQKSIPTQSLCCHALQHKNLLILGCFGETIIYDHQMGCKLATIRTSQQLFNHPFLVSGGKLLISCMSSAWLEQWDISSVIRRDHWICDLKNNPTHDLIVICQKS
jgi:hypothetical protein